jgi:hypothetical protein
MTSGVPVAVVVGTAYLATHRGLALVVKRGR